MQKTRIKINEYIKAEEVRLISSEGEQMGVMSFQEALRAARTKDMDLVLMTEEAKPPVCKVMDFKKHIFEKKKQQGQAKRNHKRTILKEIKFRPDTGEGDYQVKLKRLIKFLTAGDRAKVTIRFRGREVVYKNRGFDMVERVTNDLIDIAEVEQSGKMEGKLLITVFKPLGKGKMKQAQPIEQPSTPESKEAKPNGELPDVQSEATAAKPAAKPVAKPAAKTTAKTEDKTATKPAATKTSKAKASA